MTEHRGYKIVTDNDYLMKKIEAIGRGSVHLSLRGLYTTEKYAKNAIDVYENRKEELDGQSSVKASISRRS